VTTFADTSALYAVLDADDGSHQQAGLFWTGSVLAGAEMITTNYVIVETQALLQRRIGVAAARAFASDMMPIVQIHWVDEELHAAALTALLIANRRELRLVDCVSFELMRRLGIRQAFAFDRDFTEQGFDCIP